MAIEWTTVERVKALLGAGGTNLDSSLDSLIGSLIALYSSRFEKELGRKVETTEYTQTFDIEDDQRLVFLPAFPVAEVAAVRNDISHAFDVDTEVDEETYYLDAERGVLIFEQGLLVPGFAALQVTWTGGMTDDGVTDPTASFIDLYPDLAAAVDMQCCETVRRKDRMGASNTSFAGGGTTFEGALKVLPEVERTLAAHKRLLA
jgi:hypothetical protein